MNNHEHMRSNLGDHCNLCGDPMPPNTTNEIEAKRARLAQLILGKLEYRGFYDCNKYLDDDILEAVDEYTTELLTQLNANRTAELQAHAQFVESVLDGEKPEVAWRELTKTLDAIN